MRAKIGKRKKQLEDLIAKFNEVAKTVTTLDTGLSFILPRLKENMKALANRLESIQAEIQGELDSLEG